MVSNFGFRVSGFAVQRIWAQGLTVEDSGRGPVRRLTETAVGSPQEKTLNAWAHSLLKKDEMADSLILKPSDYSWKTEIPKKKPNPISLYKPQPRILLVAGAII